MWKLIFNTATNIGVSCDREPEEGEYSVDAPKELCGEFRSVPWKYECVDSLPVRREQSVLDVLAATEELEAQKALIVKTRYSMETADLVFGEYILPYDREDRTLLDSTLEKIRRGVVASIQWKCKNGYLTLDAENIGALELAGMVHIQAAFEWEKLEVEKLVG